MISENLKNSSYPHGFLCSMLSAGEVPDILSLGRKKIIKAGPITKILSQLFGFSQYVLQKGAGRDDEVIEELTKLLPDFSMIAGGTIDDGPNLRSYQFYNKSVLKNSVVSLGLKMNAHAGVLTTHNMKKTDIDFRITKMSKDGRIIHEINGKPAASEFIRLLGWSKDFLSEERWFKTNFYFPLGFRVNNSDEYGARVIGVMLGESLVTTVRSKNPDAAILTIDGQGLLQAVRDNIASFPPDPMFGLIASCTTRLETLGAKVYEVQGILKEYFKEKPFIDFYVGGESTYSEKKGLKYMNISFNSSVFYQ